MPVEYRLESFSAGIDGQDVWSEWNEIHPDSESKRAEARRVKDRWGDHLEDTGRHYASATPEDVESFMDGLFDEIRLERAYRPYWLFLTFLRKERNRLEEDVQYTTGHKGSYDSNKHDSLPTYVHAHYEDIRDRYLDGIYTFGLGV